MTFKSLTGASGEKLRENLTVFRMKYLKPQSMATAKHKLQTLVFDPANQKLVVFHEFQKRLENAFGIANHSIIEQFVYKKMSLVLKKRKFGPTWRMARMNKSLHTQKRN